MDGLYYSSFPGKGYYANLMDAKNNVDFHLLLSKVARIKLMRGQSVALGESNKSIPTFTVRLLDQGGAVGASIMVMWRPGEGF